MDHENAEDSAKQEPGCEYLSHSYSTTLERSYTQFAEDNWEMAIAQKPHEEQSMKGASSRRKQQRDEKAGTGQLVKVGEAIQALATCLSVSRLAMDDILKGVCGWLKAAFQLRKWPSPG
ncbi:hypothetical protein AYO21_00925 [Fonsecaea monophora]|uniref:Uncharacterized protein n=1 Tax=Fonsecaea monophora TaxID=254056 RepID=A0A177FKX0_9EURO|nr:hypothetical protein AYO21_00925 [Fonsecaea monophora]KAH0844454.1 hypothetical protein FOPE_10036 [Fonsecaea pedrosoi]OAG44963.1 hypothetical protein AYO21_00925 [Fonsecaea monophora]